jgi:fused signal recognition particle receptor
MSGIPGIESLSSWIGLAVAALLVALFVFALVRKRRQRRRELAELEVPERKALEAKKERPAAGPPAAAPAPRRERAGEAASPMGEAALAAQRAARAAEAARLEAKRLLEEARDKSDTETALRAEQAREAAARARQDAEALAAAAAETERRLKQAEEERRKAEYRTRRAQEQEERERRRLQAEDRRRAEEEEARQRARQEEERRRDEEEAERRKIQAQAGKTLAEGLAKTRGGFVASLNSFFGRTKVLDESVLGELEEVLFSADIGVKTATDLLEFARAKLRAKDLSDAEKLKAAMREEVQRIVDVKASAPEKSAAKPYVIMVVGVNGSGKTTTIGKMAAKRASLGERVLLAAGDTFRAAATEQLEAWGARSGSGIVKGKEGSDPGAVIFDAIKRGQAEGADTVICDTAGRLHTKAALMEELKRVRRVMAKALPGAPHQVLLVLDATNGQNAIAQAREFHSTLGVDGIVLTKLDGTAKGGVVIGICDELKLPVRFVGVGESVEDLKPFDPAEYVRALLD